MNIICGQVTRAEQEIESQIIKCNFQITSLASHVGSATLIEVVKGIISGETEAADLEKKFTDEFVSVIKIN